MSWPRRAIAVLALVFGVLALGGCSVVVLGQPSPAGRPVDDASPDELRVVGATDGPVDEVARNALADLETFWAQQFPDVFGAEFPRLQGGYFSVDPSNIDPAQYPEGVGCGAEPQEVENNAFYCQAPNTS